MLRREPGQRELVVGGRLEHAQDLLELGSDLFGVGLGEDRANDRGGHRAGGLLNVRRHVAYEVDFAKLPAVTVLGSMERSGMFKSQPRQFSLGLWRRGLMHV